MEADVVPAPLDLEWIKEERADASNPMRLHVIFKKSRAQLEALESTLIAVSTPGSPRYGLHLTREQVNAMVAPPAAAVEAVESWLEAEGLPPSLLTRTSRQGDTLSLEVSVATAEALLSTELHVFRHRDRLDVPPILRAAAPYTLPSAVARVVSMVADVLVLLSGT